MENEPGVITRTYPIHHMEGLELDNYDILIPEHFEFFSQIPYNVNDAISIRGYVNENGEPEISTSNITLLQEVYENVIV